MLFWNVLLIILIPIEIHESVFAAYVFMNNLNYDWSLPSWKCVCVCVVNALERDADSWNTPVCVCVPDGVIVVMSAAWVPLLVCHGVCLCLCVFVSVCVCEIHQNSRLPHRMLDLLLRSVCFQSPQHPLLSLEKQFIHMASFISWPGTSSISVKQDQFPSVMK